MQQNHIELLERKVEHYVEQQSLFAMMRGDLEKYKKCYEKSVKDATPYSPFTPQRQYTPVELVTQGKRNEIIDLNGVMGETKTWHQRMQDTIDRQKEEIE